MNSIIHYCRQGSSEWLSLRSKFFTASELSAAAGMSKYQTRDELLRLKSTGITPDVDAAKQRLFDAGHAAEAAARPIVEGRIGAELFPITMSLEVEGVPLLASLDGITMEGDVIWECKLLNVALKDDIERGALDLHYAYQIEQQLLVSGAEKCYFTASDGTEEGTFCMWYESSPDLRSKIISIWKQFASDLRNYTPTEVIPTAVAEPQMALPALAVNVSGALEVRDNLSVFGDALRAYIERINKTPETDQDFANLEASAKLLREAQTKIAAARDSALGQVNTIDAMKRTADLLEELARKAAIECENIVKREKEARKAAIVQAGRETLRAYISECNKAIGRDYMPDIPADFQTAVKGMKSISSIQSAVNDTVANAKVLANMMKTCIELNLIEIRRDQEYAFLFRDEAQLSVKPDREAVIAIVTQRIAEHKEAEFKRIEAETARIRAEEEAKAAAKAKAEQEAAQSEFNRQQGIREAEAVRIALAEKQKNTPAEPAASVPASNEGTGETPAPGQRETPQDTGATMKLGEINAALGFTVSAEFLGMLGFQAKQEKNAKLYRACDFQRICSAIARHCDAVGMTARRAA